MKSILISIQPKWVEKIVNGEKTIEVRKTAPEVPFKGYIYCTKAKPYLYKEANPPFELFLDSDIYEGEGYDDRLFSGKVVGEFVCNKVDNFYCVSVPYQRENNLGYGQFIDNGVYKVNGWHEGISFERNDKYIDTMLNNNNLKEMCLTAQELFDYIGVGKHLYGLHISDLKIYDKPRELSEFYKCGAKSFEELSDTEDLCSYCSRTGFCEGRWCDEAYQNYLDVDFALTHAPSNWCYVGDYDEGI